MSSMQREYATELGLAVFYDSRSFTSASSEYASIYDVSFGEAIAIVKREYYNACRGGAKLTRNMGIMEDVS
jgi:hypothetical protein